MDSNPETEGHVPLAEICRTLTLSPASVRSFLQSFPEIGAIHADPVNHGGEGLRADAALRLGIAARARGMGVDDDHIHAILAGEETLPEPPRSAVVDADVEADTDASSDVAVTSESGTAEPIEAEDLSPLSLAARLHSIQEKLASNDERHARERDEFTLALLRTQQELHEIRSELASSMSRRNRRRGFFSRLFGS